MLLFCQNKKRFEYYNWKCIIRYKPDENKKELAKCCFLLRYHHGLKWISSSFTNLIVSQTNTGIKPTKQMLLNSCQVKRIRKLRNSRKTNLKMQVWLKTFVSVPILAYILKKNIRISWKVLERFLLLFTEVINILILFLVYCWQLRHSWFLFVRISFVSQTKHTWSLKTSSHCQPGGRSWFTD